MRKFPTIGILIADIIMLEMTGRQNRGGFCFVGSNRYANNLYGWAMSQYLPYANLEFETEATLEAILSTPDNNDRTYTVEVDLELPKHLHDKFK